MGSFQGEVVGFSIATFIVGIKLLRPVPHMQGTTKQGL